MTDLEDLADIATPLVRRHWFESSACGAGHPWTAESTRHYRVGKRIRRVCRICDKLRATERRKLKHSLRHSSSRRVA